MILQAVLSTKSIYQELCVKKNHGKLWASIINANGGTLNAYFPFKFYTYFFTPVF
ncbi:hypothetical protein Bealeia1_00464 [Candidatus Bealeia paramacronuclearis]|uniref:Uncharacterized protein n=1 Tax=Candidatus Bealeia paramacronuclearis TaxID=1921001 RepID=A0ABZ2C2I9_9PROT|nr:hypothetical protein [Candidatus Bealeia paramacronuclearis]